jgi:hypothetical protein
MLLVVLLVLLLVVLRARTAIKNNLVQVHAHVLLIAHLISHRITLTLINGISGDTL